MLEIPIKVGVNAEQAQRKIQDVANGIGSLKDIVGPGGITLAVEAKFLSTGEKKVISDIKSAGGEYEKYERLLKKALATQQGSATYFRQSVNSLKQQRDALIRGSAEWSRYDAAVKEATASLRGQQGIQIGSLTDLRRQRDELIKLRDATARFPTGPSGPASGPTWNELNNEISRLDGQINAITPGFNKLFNVLGKIATVQAGFIAITSAVGALTGVINSYVNRTKQVEAFNLALKNVGLTQTETTVAFREAAAIAGRLGAPLQQVEKSYQRMVPALRAVGANAEETDKFIENITARTQTLGLNTEQSGRLLEAFAQVLSKGKLQAEELNQQISELDGAFRSQLADALGVTTQELTELVEQGEVTAEVFIDAVNRMSNGVEELQKRVANGTATIQQFQNLISNINVQILQQIGQAIEPGIRAFLRLSLAVSEFFKQFTQTEAFSVITTIFNQSAKGIEVFITQILKAVNAINGVLSPIFSLIDTVLGLDSGFGGLIGIVINFVGALVLLKGAAAGLNLFQSLSSKLGDFSKSMIAAGGAVNYLADSTQKTQFNVFRQGLENTRAGITVLIGAAAQAAKSFIGLDKSAAKSGEVFKFGASDYIKAGIGLEQLGIKTKGAKLDIDAMALSVGTKFADSVNNAYNRITTFISGLRNTGPAAASAGASVSNLGINLDTLKVKALQAGIALKNAFTAALPVLAQLATTAAIGGVIAAFGALININQKANDAIKEYGRNYRQSIEIAREANERLNKELNKTVKSTDEQQESAAKSKASIDQYSASQKQAASVNTGLGATLATVAAGFALVSVGALATASTGGLAAPVVGGLLAKAFLTGAAGAGVAAVAYNRLNTAQEQLAKSAKGQEFLKSIKDQNTEISKLEKFAKNLGVEIGQTDFSNFASGSKNIQLSKDALKELINSNKEFIASKEQEIQANRQLIASLDPKKDSERIASLKAEITIGKEAIGVAQAKNAEAQRSLEAISAETVARIANGDEAERQTATIEELTKALEMQNDAIDTSELEARTNALARYGRLQSQSGQLEAANLGIELSASKERLKASEALLKSLNERIAKGGEEAQAAKEQLPGVTKIIAQETFKQAEIQKQLQDAIVGAFEAGIEKAKELTSVYDGIATGAKQTFDNITNSLGTGIQSALSLVDAAAAIELEGLEKGSQKRNEIITRQLKAAALANQVEADIAQIKLSVQTKIAQNEARIAAIRFQTEAKLAALRGDFELAAAYQEAASAQGSIITGLQQAFNIESRSIELQRQAKDQALLQKGIQEGIAKSAKDTASAIGVQQVNSADAAKELQKLSKDAKGVAQGYGALATSASETELAFTGLEFAKGEEQAENVKSAFEETKNSVDSLPDSLSRAVQSGDEFFAIMKETASVTRGIEESIARIDAALQGASQGSRRGAAPRAMGGPVVGGQQYLVNDGGGREAFMNSRGEISMLPAARNMRWTAPSSGTIIPANYIDQYRRTSQINHEISGLEALNQADRGKGNKMTATLDSGNLIQRVASAMSGSGGTQRITNNVTIQSQEPVMDASKIMTNVARMRLRNARGI